MRADWAECKLGAFVEYEKGKNPKFKKPTKDKKFCFPYIDIKAFEKGIIDSYTDGEKCRFCKRGDFLMVWDGARLGLVGKAIDGVVGSTLMRINFPQMSNEYAYFFLKSKYREINTREKGTGTPHVNPELLWDYIFPVPPLPEQEAIVKKIESLFNRIDRSKEELEVAKEKIETFRQAILKKAFDGELLSDKELEKIKKDPKWESAKELLRKINPKSKATIYRKRKDWVEVELENVLDYIQPSQYIVRTTEFKDSYKIPVLTAGKSFIKGYTNEKDNIFQNLPVIIFDDFTTAIQFVNFRFKVKSSAMKILVPSHPLINISYIYYFMKTIKINATTHKRYWISVYSKNRVKIAPLPEQEAIVKKIESIFSSLDQMEQYINENIKAIEILRQSILKKAFEGKLLNNKELEGCRRSPGWKTGKELLEEIKNKKEINNIKRKVKKRGKAV